MRTVDIMLNVIQPLRDQSWYILLSPQYNLCPWLQVQDAEVGLRAGRQSTPMRITFQHAHSEL